MGLVCIDIGRILLRSLAAAKRPPMAKRAKRVSPAKAELISLASAKIYIRAVKSHVTFRGPFRGPFRGTIRGTIRGPFRAHCGRKWKHTGERK